MKNWKKLITVTLLTLTGLSFGEDIQLINFGNLSGKEPSIEKKFNHEMNLRLATVQGMDLMDRDKTDYLKKKSDFENMPSLSRKLVNSLRESAEEKALLIWSDIEELSVVPKRKWLIGAEAAGTMKVRLCLYSLYFGEYIYTGELYASVSKAMAPVFFRSAEKVTHITPQIRSELIDILSSNILSQIEDLAISVARSELIKSGVLLPEEIKREKAPSVSDMFNIPSIEAPEIEE